MYAHSHNSPWRWHQIGESPTLFTGKALDHLPLVAIVTTTGSRNLTAADAKKDPTIYTHQGMYNKVAAIWRATYHRFSPAIHGEGVTWDKAKMGVASFLLDETARVCAHQKK
jgi:hypothetical protein